MATSISGPGGNARVAMKSAIVKPMPATRPTTRTPDHRTPDGSAASAHAHGEPREAHHPDRFADHETDDHAEQHGRPVAAEARVPEGHAGVRQREQRHDPERDPAMQGVLEPFDG